MTEGNKTPEKIAYCGVPGAYAYIAAAKIFPGGLYCPHPSFKSAYEAVAKGECDYAVLPIENSFAGDVVQVTDLLYGGDLSISGIYELPIVHNLLGIPGSRREQIKTVYSHPQALDQCGEYIDTHGFERKMATNTAVAAREVATQKDPSFAAIASVKTAELYGLDILDRGINESDTNTTRFVVLSAKEGSLTNRREAFSLILIVKNEAGAFARAITAIGDEGFNMRVIRSRPMKTLAWSYYFYVEAEGSLDSPNGREMLTKLKGNCEQVKILGNYAADIILNEPAGTLTGT